MTVIIKLLHAVNCIVVRHAVLARTIGPSLHLISNTLTDLAGKTLTTGGMDIVRLVRVCGFYTSHVQGFVKLISCTRILDGASKTVSYGNSHQHGIAGGKTISKKVHAT
jgi:hypothetical protein